MSPSEFDLRAALRDGEGDGVNVERVIAGAQAQRARHRTWLLSAAAAVVVAGVGAGSAVVWGGGSGGTSHAESAASRASHGSIPGLAGPAHKTAPGSRAAGPARPVPTANSASLATTPACPSSYPHYLLPGGGSPGQFGSDGPLFSKPVVALVVCGYGTPQEAANLKPPARPGRLVFTGSQATQLAASLENASKTPSGLQCLSVPNAFAIVGVAADGSAVGTVTTVNAQRCGVEVTNGTAIRYNWQPPSDLAPVLTNLTPLKDTPLHPTTPGMHGSPPR